MTLTEQITALLDGELADGSAVDELLHVLSVSPEKRDLLVEQIALKRHIAASAARVAPPAAADRAILAGLASIDASFGGGASITIPASTPVRPRAPRGWSPLVLGVLAFLLLGTGAAVGYLLSANEPVTEGRVVGLTTADTAVAGPPGRPAQQLEANAGRLRDELTVATADRRAAQAQLAATEARLTAIQARLTATEARLGSALVALGRMRRSSRAFVAAPPADGSDLALANDRAPATAQRGVAHDRRANALAPAVVRDGRSDSRAQPPIEPRRDESPSVILDAPAPRSVVDDLIVPDPVGPWQAAFRTHLRHSVPRVYGLAGRRTALFDKEFLGSVAVGGEGALLGPLRLGIGFGETQFSISFHTNEGGALRDSIVELSPTSMYLRGFIAPELIRVGPLSGAFELGGGYTFEAGGFGSFGVNVEYHPTPDVSLHLGGSAWMLLTERAQSIYLSTNLNGHIGVAYGF